MYKLTFYKDLSESQIQKNCVQWLKYQYPKILYHHSPLEGKRTWNAGKQMKKMGATKGCPDLLIFNSDKGNKYKGFAIEFKSAEGIVLSHQKAFMDILTELGWKVAVIRSEKHFIEAVNLYFKGE